MQETGIIILAAGSSARLGKPKQLLSYNGQSLLAHIVESALAIPNSVTYVITGFEREQMEKELKGFRVMLHHNDLWEEGMASSIRKGIQELVNTNPVVEACILAVCDQPFVGSSTFEGLIRIFRETKKGIVASSYEGTAGTPVLFSRSYFSDLQQLQGQEGAKKLLQLYAHDLSTMSFPDGKIDIDTVADYEQLIERETRLIK